MPVQPISKVCHFYFTKSLHNLSSSQQDNNSEYAKVYIKRHQIIYNAFDNLLCDNERNRKTGHKAFTRYQTCCLSCGRPK